ncbi:MAG: DAK2 domain-containing protein [Schleiferilactobacillus harbinensis]|uniref:Dihydroxyacetone kinase(DAK2)-like enzyme n=1 Tax=Schleiferilactobacillus perolens DSM 12744 TaxID=1423792 RepID=A0A0R1MZI5_9LACO|nr:DAK2 domain-containing protein [Schleiferilactobacillus perolens]KRL12953.1 dihydroxyacetone kinase(DAK2)-like enzyme [Schleiferilactobacillus perolens DSM 12744]MCI1892683.1 DAK2 domain-containing protein [Schleiferilactobacillus harbinensis]MCI1911764.1 DAK2 domain-containing protein [Schleiferilactobacillus harbinensis]
MAVTEITVERLTDMIRVAAHRLSKNVEFVNSLNVFPVPDGDTGTNMSLTLASGVKNVNNANAATVGAMTKALAKGTLMGARGNSGVISSQLFRGFAKATENKKTLTAQDLADALTGGVQTAYKAVMKPVEGTILTVAREAAKAGNKAAQNSDDAVVVMQAVVNGAKRSLAATPSLLPVLKEVGVVDSGGQGLVFIYEGFLEALNGKVTSDEYVISDTEMDEMVNAVHHQSIQGQLSTADIKYGYCTEMMVELNQKPAEGHEFNYDTFRNYLNDLGDSLLVVADDEVVKVHVHTEHPGKVYRYGAQFGQLDKIKIDNMRAQHDDIVERQASEAAKPQAPAKFGVVAVASGHGVAELYRSLGVTQILEGGQTMNPSTQDILAAVKKANALNVIILPNNGNIFMAAQQAAQQAENHVAVVPTKSIQQGMTAMLSFNPDETLKENVAEMSDSLDTVASGEMTVATRDTSINGLTIHKDDFIGIVDGDIAVNGTDRVQVMTDMILKMLTEDSEIITILYGTEGTKEEAQQVADAITAQSDDLEVEIHEGDQPVYAYLVSVE